MSSAAVVHLVSTLLMAGVILFVQVVHYPLMSRVGREAFTAYEAAHQRHTGWVVIPLMLTELATGVVLAAAPPLVDERPVALAGLALLGVIWLSTALLQAPAHGALSKGFDEQVHRRLVRSNWIRTLAWWARIPVAVALM